MTLRFLCNHCSLRIKVPDGTCGRKVKCPSCGTLQHVPSEEEISKNPMPVPPKSESVISTPPPPPPPATPTIPTPPLASESENAPEPEPDPFSDSEPQEEAPEAGDALAALAAATSHSNEDIASFSAPAFDHTEEEPSAFEPTQSDSPHTPPNESSDDETTDAPESESDSESISPEHAAHSAEPEIKPKAPPARLKAIPLDRQTDAPATNLLSDPDPNEVLSPLPQAHEPLDQDIDDSPAPIAVASASAIPTADHAHNTPAHFAKLGRLIKSLKYATSGLNILAMVMLVVCVILFIFAYMQNYQTSQKGHFDLTALAFYFLLASVPLALAGICWGLGLCCKALREILNR